MITTLLFDLGGVFFLPGNLDPLVTRYAKALGVPKRELRPRLNALWEKWKRGQLSEDQFLRGLGAKGKQVEELRGTYKAGYVPNAGMFPLLARLRKRFLVAAVSNVSREWSMHWEEHYRLAERFDALFFSCDLGMAKPQREVYLQILLAVNAGPDECIFIDDQKNNIRAASLLGFRTILFRTQGQMKAELKTLLRKDC